MAQARAKQRVNWHWDPNISSQLPVAKGQRARRRCSQRGLRQRHCLPSSKALLVLTGQVVATTAHVVWSLDPHSLHSCSSERQLRRGVSCTITTKHPRVAALASGSQRRHRLPSSEALAEHSKEHAALAGLASPGPAETQARGSHRQRLRDLPSASNTKCRPLPSLPSKPYCAAVSALLKFASAWSELPAKTLPACFPPSCEPMTGLSLLHANWTMPRPNTGRSLPRDITKRTKTGVITKCSFSLPWLGPTFNNLGPSRNPESHVVP